VRMTKLPAVPRSTGAGPSALATPDTARTNTSVRMNKLVLVDMELLAGSRYIRV
jgi:hypothetical protein